MIIRVTLKLTSAQDAETSVTTNSTSKNSFHPDDQIPSRYVTPGLKPLSKMDFSVFEKNRKSKRSSGSSETLKGAKISRKNSFFI